MNKSSNILLRISEKDHKIIKIKSALYGKSKSNFLRETALSHLNDTKDDFKKLLEMYKVGEDREEIIEIVFNYYRKNGFPFLELSYDDKVKKMEALYKTSSPLLENDFLQSNYVGIGLANSFHPHIFEAEYGNSTDISPMSAYLSDDKLKDCIKKVFDMGNPPNPEKMRSILKTRNGVRGVSNFKPAIAKFIYDNYCPEKGSVIDPCAGFSGRLCGVIASNRRINYVGIDPDERTGRGNIECASFFAGKYNFGFGFYLGCAEEVMGSFRENYYDLVFTSPPYFSVEKYSGDKNQSSVKFSTYSDWLNGFLYKIADESFRVLRSGGCFVINIKNYMEYKIADDLISYCVELGFVLEKTYNMKLSNNEFSRKKGQQNFHTEPVFVFRR